MLRRGLANGVIVAQDEQVSVDTAGLWCDVVEFERALEAGDFPVALELYASDLLDGFFMSDAPGFEKWLDGERDRLRRAASFCRGSRDGDCTISARVRRPR